MHLKVLLFLCLSLAVSQGDIINCYNKYCPEYTVSCKKTTQTTGNKRYIETIIECLDDDGYSLKEHISSEVNTLGPHTDFKSTSYSGIETIASNFYQPSFRQYPGRNQLEDFS